LVVVHKLKNKKKPVKLITGIKHGAIGCKD